MYKVLDKDTIKEHILPYLTKAKRGYTTKSCLIEIIDCILYKLKSGCQWHMLPVKHFFSTTVLSYKTVFYHYSKWCKAGNWKECWIKYLSLNKKYLDLSSVDMDGSHTPCIRGGENVSYQGRKKRMTTNSLFLTDRQGVILGMSSPMKGEHHDLYNIKSSFRNMISSIKLSGISFKGVFMNADAGFDSNILRDICEDESIIANICLNKRNGENRGHAYFDELLYSERYSIERSNAWMDSYRSVLNRFDFTSSSWKGWNYIAFMCILFMKIKKNKKFR